VQGIFGIVNTAGQDGSGAAFTGTEGNAVVLGNKFPGALHLGTNNTVRMSIASNGTTRLHTYTANGLLKTISGNGTLAIATGADLPSGSGNYIQNQTALQATSNFYISGNGRAGTSFQSPIYTRADAGTVAIRPFSNSITAIQLQNAAGTNILNVDATNARVGIGTAAPSSSLHVNGGQIRLAQTAGQTPFELLSYSNSSSLWFTSGNATQSTIVLSPNYALDWDRGVAISYTPGTTGAIAGVLDIGQVSKNDVNFTHGITRFFTNGTEKMRIASNGDVSLTGKIAFRSSDAWLRLNPTNAFTNGIYVANFFRVDGGIASGGVGTSGAGTIRATSFITSDVGFRISNTATNGTYLRGNGTNYVSSAILAADLPSGSGNYIQNQNAAAQTTSNYWLSGTGRADAYGVNNTSSTTGKGFSLYNGPATGAPQYGIMFAGVGTYGAHAGVNLDWATYLTMSANNSARGWIFKAGTGTAGNVASISGNGNLSINGRLRLGNAANTELYSNGTRIFARSEGVDGVAEFASYGMYLPRTGQTYNLYLSGKLKVGHGESGWIDINDANTRIQEGNGNAVRIQTNSGFIDIGAQNTSHAHIYTDRATFYMDKGLYAGAGNAFLNASSGNSFVNGGNFGIGTTTPANKLHIGGIGSGNGVLIGNFNDQLGWNGTGGIPFFALRFAGYRDVVSNFTGAMISGTRTNLCCSGLSQGMELDFWVQPSTATVSGDGNLVNRARVFGSGIAAWDYFYLSDSRIKDNIRPIAYGLNEVLKIKPVDYSQKVTKGFRESHGQVNNETEESFGFIAQELHKVLPELVNVPEDPDKYWTVSYGKLTPILVKAIQEQQKLIEGQQSLIDELTGRIEALEAKR
jgi:hypothetical protein